MTTAVAAVKDRNVPGLLLCLTAATGLVDAVSYLAMGHVFVANMTGNVVFLGFALVGAKGLSISASLVALGGFLVGAGGGGRLGAALHARRRRWLFASTAIQTALVTTAAATAGAGLLDPAGRTRLVVIALLAVAMGTQNATARRLAIPDLTTTVLTLTLTGLAADSRLAGGTNPRTIRRTVAVVAMLAGAVAGGALVLDTSFTVALVVTAVVFAALTVAFATVEP